MLVERGRGRHASERKKPVQDSLKSNFAISNKILGEIKKRAKREALCRMEEKKSDSGRVDEERARRKKKETRVYDFNGGRGHRRKILRRSFSRCFFFRPSTACGLIRRGFSCRRRFSIFTKICNVVGVGTRTLPRCIRNGGWGQPARAERDGTNEACASL